MADERYGCVIFDDTFSHTSGYAAISGEVRPQRISSTSNLDSDVVWVTNLGFETSRNSGLSAHSKFRRDDYLRRKVKNIGESFGLTRDVLSNGHELIESYVLKHKIGDSAGPADYPSTLSMIIANTFENISRIGNALVGYDFSHISRYNMGLREIAFPEDSKLGGEAYRALSSATSSWVNCERDAKGQTGLVFFRLEPVTHAINLLSVPIPMGEWVRESDPVKIEKILKEKGRPYLANVSVKNVHPEMNRLMNFGSRGVVGRGLGTRGNRAVSLRNWITDLEVEMLSQFANLRIKELFYCQGAIDYDWIVEAQSVLRFLQDKLMLSVSGGILAENIWTGVAANYSRKDRDESFNPVRPFITAMDRNACLMAATQLMSEGLEIHSYGSGMVGVEYQRDSVDWDFMAEVAVKYGLLPPASIVSALPAADVTTPLGIIQTLTATGDIEKLMDIDRRVVGMLEQKMGVTHG